VTSQKVRAAANQRQNLLMNESWSLDACCNALLPTRASYLLRLTTYLPSLIHSSHTTTLSSLCHLHIHTAFVFVAPPLYRLRYLNQSLIGLPRFSKTDLWRLNPRATLGLDESSTGPRSFHHQHAQNTFGTSHCDTNQFWPVSQSSPAHLHGPQL